MTMRSLAPLAEHLNDLIEKKGLTRAKFRDLMYGRDEQGRHKGGSQLWGVFSGKDWPSDRMLEKWAPYLDTTLEALLALRAPKPPLLPSKKPKPKATPAKQTKALVKEGPPVHLVAALPPPPAQPAQALVAASGPVEDPGKLFSFVVGQDGLTTINLRMAGIPMSQAMRILAALNAAGILNQD